MENHGDLSKMTFYEFKLDEAKELFKEAVVDEDEHQIIVNGSKLLECHIICMALTEQRAKIPLDIQAQANYYMSIGRSDEITLEYLRKAVSCCELFEAHTGKSVQGRVIFQNAFQDMLLAMVAEQSEYGGIAVGPAESPDKGRCGGLLKTRGLPTMTITAPSPTSASRRKLPTVKAEHVKEESLSDDGKKVLLWNFPSATKF